MTAETVAVPADLIADSTLTVRARAVAIYLLAASDTEGHYYAGPRPLVDAGMGSARVIRAAFRELEAAGKLSRSRMRGGTMLYEFTP